MCWIIKMELLLLLFVNFLKGIYRFVKDFFLLSEGFDKSLVLFKVKAFYFLY
jgi:hypothetical protein